MSGPRVTPSPSSGGLGRGHATAVEGSRSTTLRMACLASTCLIATLSSHAFATTYRCEQNGAVAYSDHPCPVGRQTVADVEMQPPSAADRAAAAARARDDNARAERMQRDREKSQRDRIVQGLLGNPERAKEAKACAKLETRARRAHEDYDRATLKEQAARRVKMQRADEDYAKLCKRGMRR